MTSRNRKERSNFDLQQDTVSPNGRTPSAAVDETASVGSSAQEGLASGTSAGKIEVSPKAIAHLASRAAQRSYGVVGLAPRHARPGWAELLRREEAHRGVDVAFPEGRVVIDLYVVIEYGTRISEVARNIMSNVKFAVESALGVPAVQVNVNVRDIRVSEGERNA
jgi:uncharacterized alkaline shock family protein YloU